MAGEPMRGLVSPKGEQFGYVIGDALFTLDDEPAGYLRGDYVVNMAGERVWRIVGDGIYSLNGMESIGYLTGERNAGPNYT